MGSEPAVWACGRLCAAVWAAGLAGTARLVDSAGAG